jgi:protein phosphatase
MIEVAPMECGFDIATLSDVGTERSHNEDACGHSILGAAAAVIAVADGVSSSEAGETASRMAVEVTLRAFSEQPAAVDFGKRIYRAAQQANIEVYDRSLVVPELRGMCTTLIAVALDGGVLHAAHVGDSRLYRLRDGTMVQLTKDHTVVGEKTRLGVMSPERARHHPDRSILTRSLGRELIVAVDRITTEVLQGDLLLLCSDGLYNALDDREMLELMRERDASAAARILIDTANERGTIDNLTAAVVRVNAAVAPPHKAPGIGSRLRRLFNGA